MFIPEDGSGVADANSYATLADANSYHTDRGNTSWTGTNEAKQAALIKATDYIEQVYGTRFIGEQIDVDQSLSWPRYTDIFASNVLPENLIKATCQLALEALTTDLNPSLARGGAVKRKKVDVLEIEYFDGAPGSTSRPAITGILKGLLRGSGLNVPTVRV